MRYLFLFLSTLIMGAEPASDTICTRFSTPAGYRRSLAQPGSFGAYLQTLPLKPAGAHTRTYTGAIARTDPYTAAVVDMSIGTQDLQQCADAVMRLRAEYMYKHGKSADISFNFTSGFKCDLLHYQQGYRYKNERWLLTATPDRSYANFLNYLKLVFSYAGTLSLEKELKPVKSAADMQIGDVFIHGGSPGHCFIIVDMAENAAHQKVFMLAQSFMPAQNIQILQDGSSWFSLNTTAGIPYGDLITAALLRRF